MQVEKSYLFRLTRLGNVLLSILIFLVSLLPFRILYFFSDLLFLTLYYILKYRRAVVADNLKRAFPEKREEERSKIGRKFYRYLADLIFEIIKMRTISRKEVVKRIKLNNPEEVNQYLNNGQSLIGIGAHYGNWELGILRLSLMTDKPVLIIYKPLSNKRFEKIFNNMRSRFNAIMVPMKQTLRKIIALKDQTHISMFLSDQTPTPNEPAYTIPFLGQPTLVYKGVEKIAKANNYPVVYCHMDRVKRGYYECTFETLFEQPSHTQETEITKAFTLILENFIHHKPELWLWSHRRWKYTTPV